MAAGLGGCPGGNMDVARRDGGGAPSREDASARPRDASSTTPVDGGVGALPCADGFMFVPSPAETGAVNEVTYQTSAAGSYAYIGFAFSGPGAVAQGHLEIGGSRATALRFSVPTTFATAGRYHVAFSEEMGANLLAECDFTVIDTGAAPELPGGPPPTGDCTGRVCGESNGAGGTCDLCPMVASAGGACMDPPSPVGPSGPGPWSCLDNASCTGDGQCRIWCPAEPCNKAAHPEGCPQGVEACWVDAHITDYEDACRQCCRSRRHFDIGYACWDDAFNVCRYPGECDGRPLFRP